MSYQYVKFFSMGLVRNGEFHMYLPPKKAGFFMKKLFEKIEKL